MQCIALLCQQTINYRPEQALLKKSVTSRQAGAGTSGWRRHLQAPAPAVIAGIGATNYRQINRYRMGIVVLYGLSPFSYNSHAHFGRLHRLTGYIVQAKTYSYSCTCWGLLSLARGFIARCHVFHIIICDVPAKKERTEIATVGSVVIYDPRRDENRSPAGCDVPAKMKTEETRGTRGRERGGQDGPLGINECILNHNLYNINKLRVYTLSAKKKK